MAAELRVPLYDVERDSTPTLVAVTGVTGVFPEIATAAGGEGDGGGMIKKALNFRAREHFLGSV